MTKPIPAQDGGMVPGDYVSLGNDICVTLTRAGFKPRYLLWTSPHVLEVKMVTNADYSEAIEIMSMECPTEASSLFGISGERELLFQFDQV